MAQTEVIQTQLSTERYLEQWLGHVRGRVRASTYEGYEALLRLHAMPHLHTVPLDSLRPLHLQNLYARLLAQTEPRRLSAGTVLNLHLVLTHALGQAVRWQLLPSNPAAGAQPPRPRRPELGVFEQSTLSRILVAVRGTRLELPAAMAVATGMRRGEILGLRWTDVDSDLGVARVRRTLQPTADGLTYEEPKTPRSRRAVVLPRFLKPHLKRHRSDQDRRRALAGVAWRDLGLVVDRGNGGAINPDSFSTSWARFLARAGLPHVRFHDLRHAHATLMLAKGVHPKIVSERLGHSSIGITLDTYSHVLPSMQSEAAQAFDELFETP